MRAVIRARNLLNGSDRLSEQPLSFIYKADFKRIYMLPEVAFVAVAVQDAVCLSEKFGGMYLPYDPKGADFRKYHYLTVQPILL